MSQTIRTFIAIELPDSVVPVLGKVQQDLKSLKLRAKWVRPENIHLTLKFLGNIDAGEIDKIGRAMSDSVQGSSPVKLAAKGVGVFPGIKRPRIIWVGLAGQVQLLFELQRKLEDNLAAVGYPKEKRPFKGHLTLGRIKESVNPTAIRQIIQKYAEQGSEEFSVNQIILFKSELTPSGAVYSELQRAVF